MTHICVGNLTFIGSDNGLSPDRRHAIIWTNAVILLIGPLGTKFSEILIEILTYSFKKMRLNVSSAKWRPFCLGLNVLLSNSLPWNERKDLIWTIHSGVLCHEQVSRTGTSNYVPQYLWDSNYLSLLLIPAYCTTLELRRWHRNCFEFIPRNMHMVWFLLCVGSIRLHSYPSGLLHCDRGKSPKSN